jgi:WD40 repeat protein
LGVTGIALIFIATGCVAPGRSPDIPFAKPLMANECGDSVYSVAFSPDGSQLASSNSNAAVCFWAVRTGSFIRGVRLSPAPREGQPSSPDVLSVAYSPDGKYLAAGMRDTTVRLIDTEAGRELRRFTGHRGRVLAVVFSPDGRFVASAGRDSSIRIWEVVSGRESDIVVGTEIRIETLSFSSDGRFLMSGGTDGIVRINGAADGSLLNSFETGPAPLAFTVFTSDGGHLLAVGGRHRIILIGRQTGRMAVLFDGKSLILSGGLSPDGGLLILGGEGKVYLHDGRTGRLITTTTVGDASVGSMAFSPDGRLFATASYDGVIRLFDSETGSIVQQLTTRGSTTPL